MATRRTSKARSAQQQASGSEGAVAPLSLNGQSTTGVAAVHNGASPSFEQIQRRAYELYIARGGTHGCDWADWFTAEQELAGIAGPAH